MRMTTWTVGVAIVAACVAITVSAAGQSAAGQQLAIPDNASALEGVPTVKVEATRERVTRLELGATETAKHRLRIDIKNGRYYWAAAGNAPLTAAEAGGFTYLSSAEPGKYIRLRQLNDRISYVEHVDMETGSVTYWGEMRIVVGK